ncbi:signal recognition particle-docking protein FtsY [Halarchaeum sp. CBA1220]|uniref:signal recognition particle-docking protein FtsY n=1 Tax=Halarchaeum sp. CBA1220 TaxID=1853682 RepID=UPI000F3A9603|nr:signal recognition particle-docking protein FtsY [Halarchaeum sp. CBA1220]QLC33366.1 signal recognition particle-docking protein FtsY [Halarchaeum sp. CBA1220]
MFDGLKEKLGRFREDAEEVAEEKAEEVEEPTDESDASPADAEESDPADADGEREGAAEPEPEAAVEEAETSDADVPAEGAADGASAASETADSEGVEADEAEPEPVEAETDADTAEADAEAAEADAEGDESEEGESSGRFGLARKAKSAVRGRVVIEEEDLEDPLWELEMALLESDVEMSVAEAILDQIREDLVGQERKFTESTGDLVDEALRDALLSVIGVGQFDFDERVAEADKPLVIVFTGINGVGKTTSIAKLSNYLEERGFSSVIANGDTYRAGANEQVREHAETLDTKLIAHEQGGDPAAVIYDAVEYAEANDIDVVLGDTAGRLHTSSDLMEQLAKIDRVVGPDMTLFVDEAVAGQDAVNRAREFDDAAEIDGAILTKADADSQGGAAISVAYVTGKPILFLGTGQGYDDLERFDPDALVDDLLGVDEE